MAAQTVSMHLWLWDSGDLKAFGASVKQARLSLPPAGWSQADLAQWILLMVAEHWESVMNARSDDKSDFALAATSFAEEMGEASIHAGARLDARNLSGLLVGGDPAFDQLKATWRSRIANIERGKLSNRAVAVVVSEALSRLKSASRNPLMIPVVTDSKRLLGALSQGDMTSFPTTEADDRLLSSGADFLFAVEDARLHPMLSVNDMIGVKRTPFPPAGSLVLLLDKASDPIIGFLGRNEIVDHLGVQIVPLTLLNATELTLVGVIVYRCGVYPTGFKSLPKTESDRK